jgi:hypothetical protein
VALTDEIGNAMTHRTAFGGQRGAIAEFDNRPFTVHPIATLVQKSKVIDARGRPASNGTLRVGGFQMPSMHQSQKGARRAGLDPKIRTKRHATVRSVSRRNFIAAETDGLDEIQSIAELRRGEIGIRNEKANNPSPESGICEIPAKTRFGYATRQHGFAAESNHFAEAHRFIDRKVVGRMPHVMTHPLGQLDRQLERAKTCPSGDPNEPGLLPKTLGSRWKIPRRMQIRRRGVAREKMFREASQLHVARSLWRTPILGRTNPEGAALPKILQAFQGKQRWRGIRLATGGRQTQQAGALPNAAQKSIKCSAPIGAAPKLLARHFNGVVGLIFCGTINSRIFGYVHGASSGEGR